VVVKYSKCEEKEEEENPGLTGVMDMVRVSNGDAFTIPSVMTRMGLRCDGFFMNGRLM
jgi:hypothetical protein